MTQEDLETIAFLEELFDREVEMEDEDTFYIPD